MSRNHVGSRTGMPSPGSPDSVGMIQLYQPMGAQGGSRPAAWRARGSLGPAGRVGQSWYMRLTPPQVVGCTGVSEHGLRWPSVGLMTAPRLVEQSASGPNGRSGFGHGITSLPR